MIIYPRINPIAFHLGPIKVHWYGLMYLFSFVVGWAIANYRAKKSKSTWTSDQVLDLIFFVALGVIFGGRLGYMLFYNFSDFIHAPWIFVKVWEGGMSFHGGLIGVIVTVWWFAKKYHKTFFEVTDFIAPIIPIGLAAGRVGNFINGYLWGRITKVSWGVIYPLVGPPTRHPSEVYEFLLEGVLLFIILWVYSSKPRSRMATSGLFLFLYGCFRFICEFFRQPDPQLGFIAFNWVTMGQLLSLPMIIVGVFVFWLSQRKCEM